MFSTICVCFSVESAPKKTIPRDDYTQCFIGVSKSEPRQVIEGSKTPRRWTDWSPAEEERQGGKRNGKFGKLRWEESSREGKPAPQSVKQEESTMTSCPPVQATSSLLEKLSSEKQCRGSLAMNFPCPEDTDLLIFRTPLSDVFRENLPLITTAFLCS